MKNIALALITGAIIMFGLNGETLSEDATAAQSLREATSEGDRVSIHCTMVPVGAVDYPLPVAVVVTNTTDEELRYVIKGRLQNVVYAVVDEKGEDVPLTRWGASWLKPSSDAVGKVVTMVLQPGETLKVEEDLARYFDLTITGKYEVQISWHSMLTDEVDPEVTTSEILDKIETRLAFEVITALPVEVPSDEDVPAPSVTNERGRPEREGPDAPPQSVSP